MKKVISRKERQSTQGKGGLCKLRHIERFRNFDIGHEKSGYYLPIKEIFAPFAFFAAKSRRSLDVQNHQRRK
jgi:hypothetical protein